MHLVYPHAVLREMNTLQYSSWGSALFTVFVQLYRLHFRADLTAETDLSPGSRAG